MITSARTIFLILQSLLATIILQSPHTALQAAERKAPDLTKYPTNDRIWVTAAEAVLRPEGYREFSAQGDLTILLPSGSKLQKGDVWAISNEERIKLDREALELAESDLKMKTQDANWESSEHKFGLQDKLADLMQKKSELSILVENEEIRNSGLAQSIIDGVKLIDQQIEPIQKQLEQERLDNRLNLKVRELEIAHKKKVMEFERAEKTAQYDSPINGTLEIKNPEVTKAIQENNNKLPLKIWLDSNNILASITNTESFEIALTSEYPILDPKHLSEYQILINEGAPETNIMATYSHTEDVASLSRRQKLHVFTVEKQYNSLAERLSNSKQLGNIYRILPESCYIVNKQDLIHLNPSVLEQKGWDGLVNYLWPNSRLVQRGAQLLAISIPK